MRPPRCKLRALSTSADYGHGWGNVTTFNISYLVATGLSPSAEWLLGTVSYVSWGLFLYGVSTGALFTRESGTSLIAGTRSFTSSNIVFDGLCFKSNTGYGPTPAACYLTFSVTPRTDKRPPVTDSTLLPLGIREL